MIWAYDWIYQNWCMWYYDDNMILRFWNEDHDIVSYHMTLASVRNEYKYDKECELLYDSGDP